MKFTVDGNTSISWSVLVEADNEFEAEEKAKKFWEHNTTSEDIMVVGVYEGDQL